MENYSERTALVARLADLETERNRLMRRARVLDQQRSKVEIAIAAATRELELRHRGLDGLEDTADQRFVASEYASDDIVKSTLAEACDYILRRADRALTVHQLLEVFEAAGRDVSGANAHRIVFATLRRNRGRFVRVAAGRFALALTAATLHEADDPEAQMERDLIGQLVVD